MVEVNDHEDDGEVERSVARFKKDGKVKEDNILLGGREEGEEMSCLVTKVV